jgi:hypothetical protein
MLSGKSCPKEFISMKLFSFTKSAKNILSEKSCSWEKSRANAKRTDQFVLHQ